jgi:hypothetical protein
MERVKRKLAFLMTTICVLAFCIVRRWTSSSDSQSVQPEGGKISWGTYDWTQIQGQDPVEDIHAWVKSNLSADNEPLVVAPYQQRLLNIFWDDDWGGDEKVWDLRDWVFRKTVILPASVFPWARREQSLSRRHRVDHLGGRPRIRYGTRRVHGRGECDR